MNGLERRYARQLLVPEMDEAKQARLAEMSVGIIGVGGLGCHIAPALAAAGIGCLHLMDDDLVSESNLPRQWLYHNHHIGAPKVHCCADFIRQHRPDVRVTTHAMRMNEAALAECQHTSRRFDLLIDASDNLTTRQAANRFAHNANCPLITAAVAGWQGHVAFFDFGLNASPCYECVVGQQSLPSCLEDGVFGPMAAWVASCAALMAIKWMIGLGQSPLWVQMDGRTMTQKVFSIQPDPQCSVCGETSHDHRADQ